jgi:hypothetical protein
VSAKKLLKKIFGAKRKKRNRRMDKPHNEEL